MQHRRLIVTIVAAAGLACSAVATAIPVTFNFGGTLTDDPYGVLGSDFSFSGSYTFESEAIDLVADAATGVYFSSGTGFGFQSLVAGTPYSAADSLFVNVANGFAGPVDQYGVFASDGLLSLELFFQDDNAAVFNSDALPLIAPALADFEFSQFRLFGDGIEFLGRIEQLVCLSGCGNVSVPEPSTAWLLLIAFGALLISRRWRRASRDN